MNLLTTDTAPIWPTADQDNRGWFDAALPAEEPNVQTPEQQHAHEQATGLRALADLIEANPDLQPAVRYALSMINGFSNDPAVLAAFMRAGRQHGAVTTKEAENDIWFTAVLAWGPVELHVNAHREEVCERVVTGTETVTKTVKDPEALAAVPEVEITETVETVEWVCKPLLATEATT